MNDSVHPLMVIPVYLYIIIFHEEFSLSSDCYSCVSIYNHIPSRFNTQTLEPCLEFLSDELCCHLIFDMQFRNILYVNTKITEITLYAFIYKLFHKDFLLILGIN